MPNVLADARISHFSNSFNSTPIATTTLAQILEEIRTGRYQPEVHRLRHILARNGKRRYDQAKTHLPAATFGGTFAPSRGNAYLQQHSGLLHLDIDHLSDVAAIKQALSADPHVVYVFISPSAVDLKAGIHVPIVHDDSAYKYTWLTIKAAYEPLYGITCDPSGKDISRLCFLSHDVECYTNFDADVFDVPPAPKPKPRPQVQRLPASPLSTDYRDYAERAIQTAVQMIQSAPMGTRHHTRLRAARLLGGYVAGGMLGEERAYGVLAQALVGHTEDLSQALKTVEDGLRYGAVYPIKPADLEAERQAWIEQHRSISRTNHTPQPTDDPWAGRRTLPLRPYGGLRMPREGRHG